MARPAHARHRPGTCSPARRPRSASCSPGSRSSLGSLWGRPTWGTWWEWDARLTTTAILFFLYLGYLALRRTGATADERGKRSAIAALIAFADVPIVHLSVTWWQTLHQQGTVFNAEHRRADRRLDGVHARLRRSSRSRCFYGYLVLERFQLAQLEEGREERELERAIAERLRAEPRRWCRPDATTGASSIAGYAITTVALASYVVWMRQRTRRLRRTLRDENR